MTHGPQQMQRFEAVLGRDGMEARRREQLAEHLPRLAIVFDNQDIAGQAFALDCIKSRTASAD